MWELAGAISTLTGVETTWEWSQQGNTEPKDRQTHQKDVSCSWNQNSLELPTVLLMLKPVWAILPSIVIKGVLRQAWSFGGQWGTSWWVFNGVLPLLNLGALIQGCQSGHKGLEPQNVGSDSELLSIAPSATCLSCLDAWWINGCCESSRKIPFCCSPDSAYYIK